MNPYRDLSDDELLEQCRVETRRGSGPGGQHRNKVETAVRLVHRPTRLVANGSERRSQRANRSLALERLREKLERRFHRDRPREKLERRFHRDRPRVATRKPKGVRQRELDSKRKSSEKKRLRRRPDADD